MSCDSLTARGRAAPSGRCASHRCCCHAALARRPVLAPTARPVPSVSGVPLPAAPLVRQSNPPSCHQPSRPQPMPTPLVPPVGRLSQSLAAVLLPWRRGRRPQVAVATEDAQGRAARAGRWGSRGAAPPPAARRAPVDSGTNLRHSRYNGWERAASLRGA